MTQNAKPRAATGQGGNIGFLDGIRGVAVSAVFLFHLLLYTGTSEDRRAFSVGEALTSYGYLGVSIFIVVSGFVLMYPMARQGVLELPRGIRHFYFRRARRILPPYYAAVLLTLALIALTPALQAPSGTAWDSKVPITTGGLISHLLLLHDLSPTWVNQINGPLWSVAVEFHLYLLMPILLLPLWRRFNPVLVVALLFLGGLGLSLLDLAGWAHPWLIALFAAGMLASQVATGAVQIPHLRTVLIVGSIASGIILVVFHARLTKEIAVSEMIFGLVTACSLALLAQGFIAGRQSRVVRLLESRPFVYLGIRSYSIYLIHTPLFALGNVYLVGLEVSPAAHLLCMFFVVTPAALLCAEVFHRMIERPFSTSHQREARV